MNDRVININDLNAIIEYLVEDKAHINCNHKNGLRFKFCTVNKQDDFPADLLSSFKKSSMSNLSSVSDEVMAIFQETFEAFTQISPLKNITNQKENPKRPLKHSKLYITVADFDDSDDKKGLKGRYYLSDVKNNEYSSYLVINRAFLKKLDKSDFKQLFNQYIFYHLGFRQVDEINLKNHFFNNAIYTITSNRTLKLFKDAQVFPEKLMLFDIMALQAIYGKSEYYNNENNTYSPYFNPLSIHDTGGIDTIKLVNSFNTDMRAGEISTPSSLNFSWFSVSHQSNIENIIFTQNAFFGSIFLNELDNYVQINSKKYNSIVYYISDTHIQTTIDHKNKKQPIQQKLSRSKTVNGKTYTGWGHDTINFQTISSSLQTYIIDVQNVNTLRFYSSGNNDFVLTHKSRSIKNPKKIFTSSLTIKNFRTNTASLRGYFDNLAFEKDYAMNNTKNILFYVRVTSFQQWKSIHERFGKYIANARKYIKQNGNEDVIKLLATAKKHETYKLSPSYSSYKHLMLDKIRQYDQKIAFVANHFYKGKSNAIINYYKNKKNTFEYVPLKVNWQDVKDNKIDLSKLKKANNSNQIVLKTSGIICHVPINRVLRVLSILSPESFKSIVDYENYELYISKHDHRTTSAFKVKSLTGREVKYFKLDKLTHNTSLNLTIMKDGHIYINILLQASKSHKTITPEADTNLVHIVKGKKISVWSLYGKQFTNIMDSSRKDGLSLYDYQGKVSPYNKYQKKRTDVYDCSLQWKGKGSGLVTTVDINRKRNVNVVLFGLAH